MRSYSGLHNATFAAPGEVAERLNAAVLKTAFRLVGTGVRIPPSPLIECALDKFRACFVGLHKKRPVYCSPLFKEPWCWSRAFGEKRPRPSTLAYAVLWMHCVSVVTKGSNGPASGAHSFSAAFTFDSMLRCLLSPFSLLALMAGPCTAQVRATVDIRTFRDPNLNGLVQVSYLLAGHSLTHKPNARGFEQSHVEALSLVEQNGSIIDFRKTLVAGPERTDTLHPDFAHQEFFSLSPGQYDLVVEMQDIARGDTMRTRARLPLTVTQAPASAFVSDILFCSSATPSISPTARSGYDLVPYHEDTYFPPGTNELLFYAEVYNTDKSLGPEGPYLLSYQLEEYETHRVYGALRKAERKKATPVQPVLASFDIAEVPSGNYLLCVEVIDPTGKTVVRKEQFVQRNNPKQMDQASMMDQSTVGTFVASMTERDTLLEYLASMRPVALDLERGLIDRSSDLTLEMLQSVMYSFWHNRNSTTPGAAWEQYQKEVIKVDQLYGTRNKRGYETDRGITQLKYGAPNSIQDRSNDIGAPPYQIWHYYRCGRYTDRRFVFYNPDRVTNDYELLHSEVPGELNNPRWNQILHSSNVAAPNVQLGDVPSDSGERAREFFILPR
jgi:GWxTD domain-containing protein